MDKSMIEKYKRDLMKLHGSSGNAMRTQASVTQTQPSPNMQEPSPNMQPTPNMQQPTPNMQQPTPYMQQPFQNIQPPSPNMQQPSPNMQQPSPNMQQPPNIQLQPFPNITQLPSPNMQQPSPNMQQPPYIQPQPFPNITQLPSPNMQQPSPYMQRPSPFATRPQQAPTTQMPPSLALQPQTTSAQPTEGSTGNLIAIATTIKELYPIPNARVTVFTGPYNNMEVIETAITDRSGRTPPFILPAPAVGLSFVPGSNEKPYAQYNMLVQADGYLDNIHMQIPVFRGVTSLQRSNMLSNSTAGVNKGPQVYDDKPPYNL